MEKHGFCHAFCLQKPYFYKNTMSATAAAVCLRSFRSFCSSVHLYFIFFTSKQRHTYATLELLRASTDIHTLAKQMGNSASVIDRHYSKLTATMAAERLA